MLGLLRRLDGGPSKTVAHGYISRGGTLDVAGMLFAFPRRMGQLKEEGEYTNVFALYEHVQGEKGIKEYLESGRRLKFGNGIFRHYEELDQEETK